MTDESDFRLYSGDGTTIVQRELQVPLYEGLGQFSDPSAYLADQGLRDAVNVALTLGLPLLITGEPGTGKTQLAGSVARELALPAPLTFNTKTTSIAKDLFYLYDSLGHFRDVLLNKKNLSVEDYITYEALGLAILLSQEPEEANVYLPDHLRNKGPIRSVVLVDEIDKAPRDLPNDILNEIENMSFTVRETGRKFSASPRYRPILILTSNSEKNLPDAFLRRCAFYHTSFPAPERLAEIAERHLGRNFSFSKEMLGNAIQHFEEIRRLSMRKPPATAEFLAWLRILQKLQLDVRDLKPGQLEALALSYSILAKNEVDLALLRRAFIEPQNG